MSRMLQKNKGQKCLLPPEQSQLRKTCIFLPMSAYFLERVRCNESLLQQIPAKAKCPRHSERLPESFLRPMGFESIWTQGSSTRRKPQDFPGGPVVMTPSFHCRGTGLIPGWGSSTCLEVQPWKIKEDPVSYYFNSSYLSAGAVGEGRVHVTVQNPSSRTRKAQVPKPICLGSNLISCVILGKTFNLSIPHVL